MSSLRISYVREELIQTRNKEAFYLDALKNIFQIKDLDMAVNNVLDVKNYMRAA